MSNKVNIHEGKRFSSLQEFHDALKLYQTENNCIFVTSNSTSIVNENKKLLARGCTQLYNDNLVHKNWILTCKFGGDQRIGKGTGQRQHQSTFKIGCPAKIHLIARKDHLFIKEFNPKHEHHSCTTEEVKIIPEARKVHPEDLPMVETLLDGRVKPSRIRMLLRGTQSGRVTPRDIANLRAKKKRESEGGRSKAELLCDTLCKLHEQDPEAYIHIQKDLEDNLEVLFIQTTNMRMNVQKYGSVLLFDHTYKICEESMPVSVLQVMDGNGAGRCGGFAFIANEEMVTIATVLQAFKESIGEEASSKIYTVVIDKDYSEAGAIKTVLPHAETQLCDFHVTKTLKSRSSKEEEIVKTMVMEMRYCETDERFQQLAVEVKKLASNKFYEYFDKNWIKCPMAWSYRDKKKSPHFGNTTTGRLEKLNATFKLVLNSKSALYESVHAITESVKNKEDDVMYSEIGASVKHCYMTKNNDPIVTKILNELTLYAAKKMLGYKAEAVEGVTRRTDTTISRCGCTIFTHTFLPCPHILQLRIETGLCWYDPDAIISMYKKSQYGTHTAPMGSPRMGVGVSIAPAKIVPKTSAQKYNATLAEGKKIASLLSECGQDQYRQRFQVLIDLWKIWAGGKEATVVTLLADKPINGAEIQITEQDVSEHEEDQNTPLRTAPLQMAPLETEPLQTVHLETEQLQKAPLQKAPQAVDTMVEDVPQCFCNEPCIRLKSRPDSYRPNRWFWKCGQVRMVGEEEVPVCGFFRLAKTQTLTQPLSLQQKLDSGNDSNLSLLLDDGNDSNLSLLVEMMEKDERGKLQNDFEQNLNPEQGSEPQRQSDPGTELDSEKESAEPAETHSEKNAQNSALKEIFANISLPKGIVHRGRPKNLGKTVHNWSKGRKARPLISSEDGHSTKTQLCQNRASQIKDSDVVETGHNLWTVTSQTSKSKTYSVTKVNDICDCLAACSKCFGCSCPDFSFKRHIRACKHIFKVAEMRNRAGNHSNFTDCSEDEIETDFVLPVDRSNVTVDRSNVTIRKKRGASWDAVDVKPKLIKTSGIIETVVISDSDSDSDDKNINAAAKTGGEDCPVCLVNGPPLSGGHKCARCPKLVHAFGCSAPNPGGVEGHGGSDRLCWPCFHKVTGSRSKGDGENLPCRETFSESVCVVCELPEVGNNQCISCKQPVHSEECSLNKVEGLTCKHCYCLLCKGTSEQSHVCLCHICTEPAVLEEGVICYRCEKITHPQKCSKKLRAREKNNELRYMCENCLYALSVGVSVRAKAQVTANEMLSDEHMVRASLMLAAQFSNKVDGFCAPIGVTYGNRIENIDYYPHWINTDIPWVQILSTGQEHWVTAIFQKGLPVKIMDSMRSKPISGHTKIQVAMIMHSKDRITIGRPPCKQQANGVDCGLFAIANATEFCFSSEIQHVDFDAGQLRSHWLQCLEDGNLTPFPRISKRPKKVKEQEEFDVISTHCSCRLPENYGNLVQCDWCSVWYHRICVGLQGDDEGGDDWDDWYCRQCIKKL